MRKILLLLLREGELNRDQIISYIEVRRPMFGLWKPSTITAPPEPILQTTKRVTYDRTFKRLRLLGLVEGYPQSMSISKYKGTFWHGYNYKLTMKGKAKANKIKRRLLKDIEEYLDLLKGEKEYASIEPKKYGFCPHCGLWHRYDL